jgi:hypothetical protein
MGSIDTLNPLGRLYVRPFQNWVIRNWHWDSKHPGTIQKALRLPGNLIPAVNCWLNDHTWNVGCLLQSFKAEHSVFTDASTQGWGAHTGAHTAKGFWTEEEKQLHINVLEYRAVRLALQTFLPIVKGKSVLIHTDNTTTLNYINKLGGTRSATIRKRWKNF